VDPDARVETGDSPVSRDAAQNGAFSVSPSLLPTVQAYIHNQAEHHRKRNFEQEFRALLDKSGVPYDAERLFAA
jgi:hypothetical protein